MARTYRTGKRLNIAGVVVEPGTPIPNAEALFGSQLLAMLSANDLVLTQTDIVESNQTSQFISTSVEKDWSTVLPNPPEVDWPLTTVVTGGTVSFGQLFARGAGVQTIDVTKLLFTTRSATTLVGTSTLKVSCVVTAP